MIKRLAFTAFILFLSGCSTFFDKDNAPVPAPLVPIQSELSVHQLWSTRTGSFSGNEYLKLSPTLSGSTIYMAGVSGIVTAVNKWNGQTCWQVNTGLPLTSGPGAGDGILVIGSRQGQVIALDQRNGALRWRQCIDGEVLAKPAIARGIVVIKTIDGVVHGLSVEDGHVLWTYQQTEPSLILRGSSAPRLSDGSAFVGFANGNLVKLSARTGRVDWLHTVAVPEGAFSIQRMIDIDADPILFEHHVYAATYQGKIASLQWSSGETLWEHDISSYTGMSADDRTVYISDAHSFVWAFGADNGTVRWQQSALEARNVTGPAMMWDYVVLGDAEGYLHWLSKHDGHLAARVFVGNTIVTAPLVEYNVVYVATTNGSLAAYQIGC